jgi:hypothetical protein
MKTRYFAILSVLMIATQLSFGFTEARKKKKNDKNTVRIETNINGNGYEFELEFSAGESHNHPTIAVWMEDMEGNFIQALFVTESFANGIYRYGKFENKQWTSGTRLYRAALPYFVHKWAKSKGKPDILPSKDEPVYDAFSAATPDADFILNTRSDDKTHSKFKILVEINQTWDFNEYWHNAKYPDDTDYKTSCQPSLIYAVTIDTNDIMEYYVLNPIGHGHYSGKDGKLYTDISTLTTAKNIAEKLTIRFK